MTKQEQDKLWNDLSEEKKKEYRTEFQQESELYHQNEKHCDRENEFEYNTGYSNGVATTLEALFGEHNLKPVLTYEDVARELGTGDFKEFNKKLEAIGRLMTVAKYLNKNEDGSDWVPDWENEDEVKWYPCIYQDKIKPHYVRNINWSKVYFRTEELLNQAVQILGKDVVRTALTTKY